MRHHPLDYYKRKISRFYRPVKIIAGLVLIGLVSLSIVWAGRFILRQSSIVFSGPAQLATILFDKNIDLASQKGRVNLLLLGIGGSNHTSGQLTDAILLVSISAVGQPTVIVNLPRDLWVNSMQAKLNTAYYYGEKQAPGGGLILAKAAVKELTDIPVHYAFVLDFQLFKSIIDLLGGISVDIGQSFTDEFYPLPGREEAIPESSRYETISFTAGSTVMDGTTALKYVRSRHANGDNGTDFDRARRQQEVILAIKARLLSGWSLTHPRTIWHLKNLILSSLITDLPSNQQPDLIKMLISARKNSSLKVILNTGTEDHPGLLYSPLNRVHNQWVLLPRGDNPTLLPDYFTCLLNANNENFKTCLPSF